MLDQNNTVEELKVLPETQVRTLEERSSRIETARENNGGLLKGPVRSDQPSCAEDAGTGERGRSASSRRGESSLTACQKLSMKSRLRGAALAMLSRELGSSKTAVPKLGSSIDFALWKRLFKGFALSNDSMQGFFYIDMPLGDSSVASRSLLGSNKQSHKTSPYRLGMFQ